MTNFFNIYVFNLEQLVVWTIMNTEADNSKFREPGGDTSRLGIVSRPMLIAPPNTVVNAKDDRLLTLAVRVYALIAL